MGFASRGPEWLQRLSASRRALRRRGRHRALAAERRPDRHAACWFGEVRSFVSSAFARLQERTLTRISAASSLTALQSLDLSGNLLATLPAAWASLAALTSLNLSTNTLGGTLPPWLGALPGLQTLMLDSNFITGSVPLSLNRSWLSLSLSDNLLSSAALPPGLCPWACGWNSAFVVASNATGNASCASCALSTTYTQCPVPDLPLSAFAGVRAACAVASNIGACALCLPTIISVFLPSGVYDNDHIVGCIRLYSPSYVAAGALPEALRLLPTCGQVLGYEQVSLAAATCRAPSVIELASLAAGCMSIQTVCSSCSATLIRFFIPGVEPKSASRVQALTVMSCASDIISQLMMSGVPVGILNALLSCPLPPASLVSGVLRLVGAAAAQVNATLFENAVCLAVNANSIACQSLAPAVVNVADVAQAGRRLLAAPAAPQPACDVRFTLSGDSPALAATAGTVFSAAVASGAMLAALQADGGLPNLTTLSLTLVTSTVTPGPSSAQRKRVILGTVLGSVLGACTLAVCALLLRRRVNDRKRSGSPGYASDDSSHPSLEAHVEDIVLGDCIGQGGFARVHAAKWNGTAIAVKVFSLEGGLQMKASPGASVDAETRSSQLGSSFFRSFDSFVLRKSRTRGPPDASFAREMALLAALRHPNICAVYGVVSARSPPWLLLELCGGGSLSVLLRRASLQTLTWADRHAIGVGVACGVDFLHRQQPPVLHRDLKSANVVLSEGLVPKICDFGLSSFLPPVVAGTDAQPQRGTLRGTLKYMAPELLLAATGRYVGSAPQAVDVFGLGVVLHNLAHLGGAQPDPSSPSAVKVSSGEAEKPAEDAKSLPADIAEHWGALPLIMARYLAGFAVTVGPQVPPALAELILRCLSVDPAERPNARQALKELQAIPQEG